MNATIHMDGETWYRDVKAKEMKTIKKATAAERLEEAYRKDPEKKPVFLATVPSSPIPQADARALFDHKRLKDCGSSVTKRNPTKADDATNEATDITTDHFDGRDFQPLTVAKVSGRASPEPFKYGGVAATQAFKVPGPDAVKGGRFVSLTCDVSGNPGRKVKAVETPEGHVSIGTLMFVRHYVTPITKPDGSNPGNEILQLHFGPRCTLEAGHNVEFWVLYREEHGRRRLVTQQEFNDMSPEDAQKLKQMAYFSWRVGSKILDDDEQRKAICEGAIKYDAMVKNVAPDHHADMWRSSEPVTHDIPAAFDDAERKCLFETVKRGLREPQPSDTQMTVHLRLDDRSCFTNGTINHARFTDTDEGRGSEIFQNSHELVHLAELLRAQPQAMILNTRLKLLAMKDRKIRLSETQIKVLMGESLVEKSMFKDHESLLDEIEKAWAPELKKERQKREQRRKDVLALKEPMTEKEIAIAFNFWPGPGHTLPKRSVWDGYQTRLNQLSKDKKNIDLTKTVLEKELKGKLNFDQVRPPFPSLATRVCSTASPPHMAAHCLYLCVCVCAGR